MAATIPAKSSCPKRPNSKEKLPRCAPTTKTPMYAVPPTLVLQLIEQKHGKYKYGALPRDGARRMLKGPQTLENGAVYYGFWYDS